MPSRRASLAVLFVTAGALALWSSVRPVEAQAALPYLAYGVGVQPGQGVEARIDGVTVAQTAADRAGRWKLAIEPGSQASNGDEISFFLDGVATGVTVTFQSGRFPAPPGIALTSGGSAPTTGSPAATPRPTPPARPAAPAARPTATPRPKAACTKGGRAAACQPFTIAPPR